MRQWLRKARLTAKGSSGNLVINPVGLQDYQLRISFQVSKSISSSANTARITIYNLNADHRNAIGKEWDDIMLEVGYTPPEGGDNIGIIFQGQMRDVEHHRDGPDILTILQCGDGDRAFRHSTISKTFPKGTEVGEVVDELQKQFEKENISRGEIKLPENTKPFKRPYSMCGSCTREMDRLGRSNGFYWSIQNGALEAIPADGFIGGVVQLSPQTGLIDTPTITDNGVKFSALLNPEIRPNRRVKIISEVLEMNAQDSMYRVSSVDYSGDNQENDFKVTGQGEAIVGGKVDEGKKK